jgi:hypothetical protein
LKDNSQTPIIHIIDTPVQLTHGFLSYPGSTLRADLAYDFLSGTAGSRPYIWGPLNCNQSDCHGTNVAGLIGGGGKKNTWGHGVAIDIPWTSLTVITRRPPCSLSSTCLLNTFVDAILSNATQPIVKSVQVGFAAPLYAGKYCLQPESPTFNTIFARVSENFNDTTIVVAAAPNEGFGYDSGWQVGMAFNHCCCIFCICWRKTLSMSRTSRRHTFGSISLC